MFSGPGPESGRLSMFRVLRTLSLPMLVPAVMFFAMLLTGPRELSAQESDPSPEAKPPPATTAAEDEPSGTTAEGEPEKEEKKRFVELEELQIMGEIDRPRAFIIIPRAGTMVDKGRLSKNYTDEILDPVIKHTFEQEAFIILRPIR